MSKEKGCLFKERETKKKKKERENLGLYSGKWMKSGSFLCGYPKVKALEMKGAKHTMLIHRKKY